MALFVITATGPAQRQLCSQFKDESGKWSDEIVGYGFALLAESKFIKGNSWVIPGGSSTKLLDENSGGN